jgi:hypothetical protein
VSYKPPRKSSKLKSELFQKLEGQCYPVLKLEVEIQTFAIIEDPKVDLTHYIINKAKFISYMLTLDQCLIVLNFCS